MTWLRWSRRTVRVLGLLFELWWPTAAFLCGCLFVCMLYLKLIAWDELRQAQEIEQRVLEQTEWIGNTAELLHHDFEAIHSAFASNHDALRLERLALAAHEYELAWQRRQMEEILMNAIASSSLSADARFNRFEQMLLRAMNPHDKRSYDIQKRLDLLQQSIEQQRSIP